MAYEINGGSTVVVVGKLGFLIITICRISLPLSWSSWKEDFAFTIYFLKFSNANVSRSNLVVVVISCSLKQHVRLALRNE